MDRYRIASRQDMGPPSLSSVPTTTLLANGRAGEFATIPSCKTKEATKTKDEEKAREFIASLQTLSIINYVIIVSWQAEIRYIQKMKYS